MNLKHEHEYGKYVNMVMELTCFIKVITFLSKSLESTSSSSLLQLSSEAQSPPEVSQVSQGRGVMLLTKCLVVRCNECSMHLSVRLDDFRQKYKAACTSTYNKSCCLAVHPVSIEALSWSTWSVVQFTAAPLLVNQLTLLHSWYQLSVQLRMLAMFLPVCLPLICWKINCSIFSFQELRELTGASI